MFFSILISPSFYPNNNELAFSCGHRNKLDNGLNWSRKNSPSIFQPTTCEMKENNSTHSFFNLKEKGGFVIAKDRVHFIILHKYKIIKRWIFIGADLKELAQHAW